MSTQQEDRRAATSFVKLVEQYPCLWNYTWKTYFQIDQKDKAWRKIVEKLNDTGKKKLQTILII